MNGQKVKEKIRSNFNKVTSSYDQNCTIQNEVCKQSMALLLKHQNHFNHIADFACGTGESTIQLLQNVYYEKCHAIDFAGDLLGIARKKLGCENKIVFVQGDLDEPLFKASCFDLIFSNMGLQWATSLSQSIALLSQYLVPGGILIFSMPIDGNFPEIKSLSKLALPSQEVIIDILKSERFEVIEFNIKTLSETFTNQLELLKSLKGVGANYNKLKNRRSFGLSRPKNQDIFVVSTNAQLTYKIGIYLAMKK